MSTHPASFDHMLAAWNERNPDHVRGHLERSLCGDVHFVDPTHDITGVDAFEQMVHDFHNDFPGAVCSHASDIDSHHHIHRYAWEIHQDDRLLLPGFDVVETDATGMVARVFGFFGPLPPRSD